MLIEPLIPLEFTRILVPVDCTPASKQTINAVARLTAKMVGVQILLMAVVAPTEGFGAASSALQEAREEHAAGALQAAREQLRSFGYRTAVRIQVAETLTEAIEKEVSERFYHLIVLGANHLNSDPTSPCEPTDAEAVMRATNLPVIFLPPSK